MTKEFTEKHKEKFYFFFRVLVGLLFFQHGAQKLFGWFTENPPVELYSLIGLAGIIEFFGGLAIALGLFTSFFSLISALTMLYAYFVVHAPKGLVPIINKGELALLYFAAFLILIVIGSRKYSLDNLIFRK